MLARITCGQDAEIESKSSDIELWGKIMILEDSRMDNSDTKKIHTDGSNAPKGRWVNIYRNSQLHPNLTAMDRSQVPRGLSGRSDSLLYLNVPGAPRRPS